MARAPAGSGTIRKKTVTRNGKQYAYWEGRCTVGHDPGTGKQIQRSITGKTQRDVARRLKELTISIDRGTYTAPEKITLAQWLDLWEQAYLGSVKDHTKASYRGIIKNHLTPGLGSVRLDQITPHTVQQFINGLTAREKPLSAKTVKNIHGVLHAALRQAVLLRYTTHNPAATTRLPRVERKEMHVLDEESTAAFLQAVEGHKFEILYKFALFTGMREGEVLGLTWDRVDFDRGAVTIDRQLQKEKKVGGQYHLTSTKNDKARTVIPPLYVLQLLRTQRARQAEQRLSAGDLWQDKDLVFTNETGGNLVASTVLKRYKQIVARIGCPDLRFHDLRHSYAVAALRSGDDVKTLQGNLGHHAAAFTLDQYGHITDQMKQASAEHMETYIKGILKG